ELELKKQFDKALAVYAEILETFKGSDHEVDVALFNRVGDLHLKQGNVADAVDCYERAVDHYVETGFYNNAIALCNKILRSSPGRASIYYKLGKISAHKGFKSDAKANFLEYADRMQKSGKTTEAFRALKEFADLCPDQDDIRLMLADQLTKQNRRDEAVEQLQLLYERYKHEGRETEAQATVARMKAIDPSAEPREPGSSGPHRPTGDLVFLDLNDSAAANRRSAIAKRATQGLDLLATGEQDSVPTRPKTAPPAAPPAAAPRAAAPAPAAPPTRAPQKAPPPVDGLTFLDVDEPPPARPAAPAPASAPAPAASAPEPVVEESLPEILDTPDIEPAVLDGVTRAEDFVRMDTDQQPGLLDGLQTTGLADDDSMVNSGTVLDLEPTSFSSPTHNGIGGGNDGLLDFDMVPGAGFGEAETAPLARGTPDAGMPMLDDELPQDAASAPAAGPADFVLREDVDLGPPPRRASPKAPVEDLPLMDFELPVPSESTSGVRGSHAEPELEMLELTEPDAAEPIAPARAEEPSSALFEVAAEDSLDLGEVASPEEAAHPSTAMAAQSVELLQAMADSDPEDHGVRRRLAEAMLEAGDREGGLRELEAAMISAERSEDLDSAAALADEIVRLNPSSVRHHQKRVEYAFRLNERGRLIDAYLELADALFRAGQLEKSRAIYQRVLDLAPDDARARAALESFPAAEQPPAAAPASPRAPAAKAGAASARTSSPTTRPEVPVAASDDFVNLGDWLRGDETRKSTRMVVPEQEPTGDEEADFQDMLRKFKQGIAENVDEEDHQSHYDLGVAYKEMGLVDEAIAEFQKALRAPSNRVPTYEALGSCFIEKEQYGMAATILARALDEKGVTDDNLVGVLYLLGRCAEARGQQDAALEYYQRVFVVDIQFRDIGERMAAVEGGRA
ncbi:MAG TPA: tetratricopeptide repeat protein, partial [Gemmatimonadaceae bacterium]|nr:tetratricopeptide repeat protein [Gemmatimonadaceae bacterium]